ncbi:MAG: serine/threonine-protein phosphatase [Phycisphaerae bacterium]|nr:serine/threonine-protein phosphatase [Phycisphaerae bacterium]
MPADTSERVHLFLDLDLQKAEARPLASGLAVIFTARCPDKPTPNEDAAALIECGPKNAVLAVADGFGGQPAGEQASRLALESLSAALNRALDSGGTMRTGILDGFEKANEAVQALGVGAATTLVAIQIDDGHIRSYHVGDSMSLVVGQRGKLKLQTVSHSPVGYAVEAGWLPEDEALHHEDLHIVSNMVGSPEMRIEIGSNLRLCQRDTVLLASDGLFDNIPAPDVANLIRTGPLTEVAERLADECDCRMRSPDPGQPSKPDDLTFVLYRLTD